MIKNIATQIRLFNNLENSKSWNRVKRIKGDSYNNTVAVANVAGIHAQYGSTLINLK